MLCLSLQPLLLVRTVSLSQFMLCLCSCLDLIISFCGVAYPCAVGDTAAVQQTAQCGRHPCFGCTSADAFLPDRFDSCSVDDSLQRQLYLRDERL
jgi:hypothetical protein